MLVAVSHAQLSIAEFLRGNWDKGLEHAQDACRPQAPNVTRALSIEAVQRLDRFARENYGKRVIHLALRWVLDQTGVSVALWGARRPDLLDPITDVMEWRLSREQREEIVRIVENAVVDPIGPEFMAPPAGHQLAA